MGGIEVTCQECGAHLRVGEDKAGKLGKCPNCGAQIIVPVPEPESEGLLVPEPEPHEPVEAPGGAPDVLAGYRQTAQPSGSALKRGFGALKARARAARLRWDAKKLRRALEDQSERLGVLTVQHQPAEVDIGAEVSEISRVQAELSEKRATLESLRGTKGSGSVVKELKGEEAQLVARQRELMVAIGAKADAVRPEMPGAAGHYSAMDAVRAQLGQKEAQLADLEGQIGPVADAGTLSSLKKPLLTVLVIVAAVAALYFAGTFAWGLVFPRESLAHLLPEDTVAYLRLANLQKITGALEESGLKERIIEEIKREGALPEDEIDAIEETVGKLRALHVSFHGVSMGRRRGVERMGVSEDALPELPDALDFPAEVERPVTPRRLPPRRRGRAGGRKPDVDLLVIAEGKLGDEPEDWLPPSLSRLFTEDGKADGVKVYKLKDEEMLPPGMGILVAARGGKVFISTDRSLLEDVLEAADGGRSRSLADNEDYRKVTKGAPRGDAELYVSASELIDQIKGAIPRKVVKLFGLRDLKSAFYVADYEGQSATLRVLVDEDWDAYKLLARPQTALKLPEYVPEETLLFLSASLGDCEKLWDDLKDYICDKLVGLDEVDSRRECLEGLTEAEDELGVDFDDLASLVSGEIGFFFEGEMDEDEFCFFSLVNDEDEAEELLRRFARRMFGGEGRSREVEDVEVHVVDAEFVWAVHNGCAMISPSEERVRAAIKARANGEALARWSDYRDLRGLLPSRGVCLAFVNVGEMLRAAIGDEMDEVPPEFRKWIEDLLLAASISADDGMIELRVVASPEISLVEYFAALMPALDQARAQAQKTMCISNLKQLSFGLMVYRQDRDGELPASLAELYPDYLDDADVLVCPADRNPMDIGKGLKSSYYYVGKISAWRAGPMVIVAYDKRGNHRDGRNAAFVDGHVEFIPEADFRRRLQESLDMLKRRGWEGLTAEEQARIEAFYTDRH